MATDTATRELGLAYQARQARRSRTATNHVQDLWRSLNRKDLSGSYRSGIGNQMVATVTAGQLASAWDADQYVDSVVAAEGATPDRTARVRPGAFAGVAADGRTLEDLLYLPVITTKQGIAAGQSVSDAMLSGLQQALRLSASEVMQAGRGAVGASMVGQRTIQGYVRVVSPPACARCVVLAGKEYGWNSGFQRHPKCDCYHLPTTLIARNQHRDFSLPTDGHTPTTRPGAGGRGFLDPDTYFNNLSRAEQDRVFTAAGAQAIRDGGDLSAIVNARRGMYTTVNKAGDRRMYTREGTTRRGSYYRQERARVSQETGIRYARDRIEAQQGLPTFRLPGPRLLPEEIYKLAESRDDAIAMLRRYGYLR